MEETPYPALGSASGSAAGRARAECEHQRDGRAGRRGEASMFDGVGVEVDFGDVNYFCPCIDARDDGGADVRCRSS